MERKLSASPEYTSLFTEALGASPSRQGVKHAIAAFERTLITVGSPFDLWLEGDSGALSAEQRAGYEWVLIGDVSGHGVPAGLVMMMCQTSVHSVIAARPNISPDELLATVNRTLTQNIERLGEDKYMTISALRRDRDGSFKVAGMHQDLLVYRARSRRVEHLRAEGTWLGIAKNIKGLNPVRTLKLDPGDVLVLYTDGITEARRGAEMLDIQGLEQAVLAHGGQSAGGISSGILDTLGDYEVRDDVAAVIVKQLQPQANVKVTAA